MSDIDLFEDLELEGAVEAWLASDGDKGEIFTKPEVVAFMLATMGLNGSMLRPEVSVLEPSCGHGEFLVAIVECLIDEISNSNQIPDATLLQQKILAYDLSQTNVNETKNKVIDLLKKCYSQKEAEKLADKWIVCGDFLLANIGQKFSHIVGNPPYIRVENIPKGVLSAYRRRFKTMSERADIYIAFYEKSLSLLKKGGKLSFICTDRWLKNKYGGGLREYIAEGYNLDLYVDLYGKDSFQRKVLTYPAITLISKSKLDFTILVHQSDINNELQRIVIECLRGTISCSKNITVRRDIINGREPWLLGSADELEVVRKIEKNFPTLEEADCKVYIGAATGNNKVFIVPRDLDIEDSRKLPVITSRDTRGGKIIDSGNAIINTYDDNGLIELTQYPKLSAYLSEHKHLLQKRHVAKSAPRNWYKTIDRVYPERANLPKLLVPDIKSELTILFDKGFYHPNNSIYYICSNTWDLQALKAVLLSGIGKLFISTYSTKVASGFLRFQAQHLRRIRVPLWSTLEEDVRENLIKAGENNDTYLARKYVAAAYQLNENDMQVIGN